MSSDARKFLTKFIEALNARNLDAVESMVHPELVSDSPQTGERTKGPAGFIAQLRDYPGRDDDWVGVLDAQMYGDDERWAITPGYTVVPLADPNQATIVFRTQYPDGSWWRTVLIVELREDMLFRMESFWAPELPAPLAESIATYGRGA